MKKFILKLLLFLSIVIMADITLDNLYYVYDYVKGGEIGKVHQIMTTINPDVLIIGSSRASHHYNSDIISDKLGMKVYNAGFDGQGTLLAYGLLNGVRSRHTPKIILCELTPVFDIYKDDKSINFLAPYSSRYGLNELFNDIDITNQFKMLSRSYQYNSVIFRIIPNLLSDRRHFINGFAPLSGHLKNLPDTENKSNKQSFEIDSVKVKYFTKIIEGTKDSDYKLIFMISPSLYDNIGDYNDILDIACKNNIKVFNHLQDTMFINHPNLFQDATHMNEKGANKYSEIISIEISDYLKKNK